MDQVTKAEGAGGGSGAVRRRVAAAASNGKRVEPAARGGTDEGDPPHARLEQALPNARLERTPGPPAWRQIEDALRRAITERRFMPGERLPTEAEFAAYFRVHRHTFRRAVAPLVADGLVGVRQGQGMTVREEVIAYPIGPRTRFSEIIAAQALDPCNEVLDVREEPASEAIAEELAIAPGAPLVRVEMLRRSDGVPLGLSTDRFPADRFPGLAAVIAETRSVTATLDRFGEGDYRRLRSRVFARVPTEEETRLLRQSSQHPVLCVESVNVDAAGRPIQHSEVRFSAPRVTLEFEPRS